MSKIITRRRFLEKAVAASSAMAAFGFSFEEKALLAHQEQTTSPSKKEKPIKGLPMGKIGDVTISRVIIGSNLFYGGAHARNLMYISGLMKRYFTDQKIIDTLQISEENGINTNIGAVDLVKKYNKERGGKMQVIAQLDPDNYDWSDGDNTDGSIKTTKKDVRRSVKWAVDEGCVGAFILGTRADRWIKAERLDLIEEFVSFVKKNGLISGVGGHDKRVPMVCEKAGIDVDFYFKTIHPDTYWGVIPEEEKKPFLVDSFGPDDFDCMWELWPEETINFMKTVKKPWIGYKVLAAGAVHPKEGFRFAFENGVDFVCPGMFDWQVRENVLIAKEVLSESAVKNRARPWA